MLRRMMGFCHSAFAKARQIVARVDADALDCPGARVLATHIHPWRALMKTILTLLLVGLFAFGTAYAADTKTDAKKTDAMTPQQEKMKACNEQATDKKGDERKAFMKSCLSAKPEKAKSKMAMCNEKTKGMAKADADKMRSECMKG